MMTACIESQGDGLFNNKIAMTWQVFLPVFFLCASFLPATVMADGLMEKSSHMDVGLDASYRLDSLDWNIANDASGSVTPNIISELRWNSLKTLQTRAHFNAEDRQVVFRGSLAYGKIISGSNEDSDYAGDNRAQEWSRSQNDAGTGNTADASAGIGYRISVGDYFSMIPLAGFAWHEQQLKMRNGRQVVSKTATINGSVVTAQPTGPLAGLNSSYKARWLGPWLGADLDWHSGRFSATLSGRYEWTWYRGEADWNLRTDLQHPLSFQHTARGGGWRVGASGDYALTPRFSFGLQADASGFITRAGTDNQFFAAGGVSSTRLNKVRWGSASFGANAMYRF